MACVMCKENHQDSCLCECHDSQDSDGLPCRSALWRTDGKCEDEGCPQHGIAASNARANRYWQRVGGHE